MKAKQYQKPEMEVLSFVSACDIVTVSITQQNENAGGVQDDVFGLS